MANQWRARILESSFATNVEGLVLALWDANVPPHNLSNQWLETLKIRSQLVASLGSGEAVQAAPAEPVNWKGSLWDVAHKNWKCDPALVYATGDAPEASSPSSGPFVSQVSSAHFQSLYEGEPAPNKKKAEQSAAQQALAYEFPAEYKALSSGAPAASAKQNGALSFAPPGAPAKNKRSATAANLLGVKQEMNPKARVQVAAELLLERSTAQGDVVFDTQAVDGTDTFVSSVSMPAYDGNTAYFGEPCVSKKLAENSAAEMLLNSNLAGEIARLSAERAEKKARKNKEKLEGLKARLVEKKQAEQAEL